MKNLILFASAEVRPMAHKTAPMQVDRIGFFVIVLFSLLLPLLAHAERTESLQYGNLDKWTVRYIQESMILGGETKTVYAIGPRDTIRENIAWLSNKHHVIWSTSNVYARVAGIDKGSCTVFPERRGNGYCARLENKLESVCALGIINLKVMAAGTIYTGVTREPVDTKGVDKPLSVIDFGVPFKGHPTALQFDYKAQVSSDSTITVAKSATQPKNKKGFDCPMVIIRLERRWKDSNGSRHVETVGEGKMLIRQSVTSWKNNTRLPIHWTSPTAEPTHIVIQFSSGCCEPFVGHVGNVLWVDNIKLVYDE